MSAAPAVLLGVLLLLASAGPTAATEEYAACTGRACAHCHASPGGGGELTGDGTAFAAALAGGEAATRSPLRRAGTGALLFLHVAAAFMWFGTILYVHLVLKPAYAAGGLPRDEVRLGWAGIAIVGTTGAGLTLLRLSSLDALWHTRFGVLLTVKIALFLVMAATAFVVTFIVGPRLGAKRARPRHPGRGEFTAEELAGFDGREGRPALVAHAGTVYDVTGSRLWAGGAHMHQHTAGSDLTAAIARAPHGAEKLAAFAAAGTLVTGRPPAKTPPERGFYLMAYLNLGIVAAILLIIALWRI